MPPLKASSGWGIYKGEGATSRTSEALAHTCTFKPLPLIEKEKRESLATLPPCHSKPPLRGEDLLWVTSDLLRDFRLCVRAIK
ncbi:hypothetical protein [Helicobacter marmotae]|uniref:hypothetical protein n=1 Tax=Helicobacter marmotae TaxID=152490 RepID=UPI0011C058AF|nr:hypothetical protein [Helicobacter marmotae]